MSLKYTLCFLQGDTGGQGDPGPPASSGMEFSTFLKGIPGEPVYYCPVYQI